MCIYICIYTDVRKTGVTPCVPIAQVPPTCIDKTQLTQSVSDRVAECSCKSCRHSLDEDVHQVLTGLYRSFLRLCRGSMAFI